MWDNVRMLGPAFPERLKYLRLFNDKERLLRSTQHPAGDSESLNLFCLLLVISETFFKIRNCYSSQGKESHSYGLFFLVSLCVTPRISLFYLHYVLIQMFIFLFIIYFVFMSIVT